ncbi:MAG: hypothetical protein V3U76_11730 [Granulosicoccus sp.]
MSLMLFKYCLPALLGYILFVGISGRFNPLSRPDSANDRPPWMLGLWTGLSVALVLTLGLHMAYNMSLEGARELFRPTAWLLTGLLLPGFAGYFIYTAFLSNPERNSQLINDGFPTELSEAELLDAYKSDLLSSQLADSTESGQSNFAKAISDSHEIDLTANTTLIDESAFTDDLIITTNNVDDESDNDSFDSLFDDVLDEVTDIGETTGVASSLDTSGNITQDDVSPTPTQATVEDSKATIHHDDEREIHQIAANADSHPTAAHASLRAISVTTETTDTDKLRNIAARETALREETEKHLRITRKALSALESESREHEGAKAEMVMALEEALDDRTRETAAAEARASRAESHQVDVETTVVELKQDIAKSKQNLRRSTEARAHAVRTANKSVELAKQSARARKRSETQLLEARSALKNRQETISSLILALEKEKRRTQDEVASMAKQLILHEKQLKARRSLEEVARSVEGKLKSRLVKKIAKARPLSEDP